MRYARTAEFKRLYRKLPGDRRQAVGRTLLALDQALESGRSPERLGLQERRFGLWELRAGHLDRVLFVRADGLIEFLAVGARGEFLGGSHA